jgi:transposase-like protein
MVEQKQWLNEKGQCPVCRRKPLVYKRDHMKFCARCHRAFGIETGKQIENWGWRQASPDSFEYQYER